MTEKKLAAAPASSQPALSAVASTHSLRPVGGIVSGQRVSEVPRSGTPSQEAKELKGDGSSLRVISDENNTPTPGANSKTLDASLSQEEQSFSAAQGVPASSSSVFTAAKPIETSPLEVLKLSNISSAAPQKSELSDLLQANLIENQKEIDAEARQFQDFPFAEEGPAYDQNTWRLTIKRIAKKSRQESLEFIDFNIPIVRPAYFAFFTAAGVKSKWTILPHAKRHDTRKV